MVCCDLTEISNVRFLGDGRENYSSARIQIPNLLDLVHIHCQAGAYLRVPTTLLVGC